MSLIANKMTLSAFSALGFIGLLSLAAPKVEADVTFDHQDAQNQVTITQANENAKRQYTVNGKTFYFDELSSQQKQKVAAIEKKLEKTQRAFKVHQSKLDKLSVKLAKKSKEIKAEAEKLQAVSTKFKKDEMNMSELHRIADELAKLTKVSQKAIQQKQSEIHKLQQQVHKVDLSLVDDIEQQADELKETLVEIAQTL